MKISLSTIDRILANHRRLIARGQFTTTPPTGKDKVRLKLLDVATYQPGVVEADMYWRPSVEDLTLCALDPFLQSADATSQCECEYDGRDPRKEIIEAHTYLLL